MPKGTIKRNPNYGNQPMLFGDDGRWYVLPPGTALMPETRVTFNEWVRPNPPPGFYYAKDVAKAPPGWAAIAAKPAVQPAVPKPPLPKPPPQAPSQGTSRIIRDAKAQQDYTSIMQAVDRMNWSGNFGPTVNVQTPLKWENAACRELYLKIKDELHDQPIPGTRLYYYVGSIGVNWGKGGFRITGHTKPSSKIKNSATQGVLHVENN